MTDIDVWCIRIFVISGSIWFILDVLYNIKWWNGVDENGNPK